MTKRVLILGGTSYVAQFLCARFLDGSLDGSVALSCTMRSLDVGALPLGFELAAAEPPPPPPTTNRVVQVFAGVSLLELATVQAAVDAFNPTVIINCVALSSPAACERDPAMAHALNHPSELIVYLSNRAAKTPLHYLHFSTDFVYDGQAMSTLGCCENDAKVSPDHCVYSATKLAFDNHLVTQQKLSTTVLRIANVVGGPAPLFPNQPPKFAQWLITELMNSPEKHATPVRLWSDEVRSFLYVEDLVRVVWRLVTSDSHHQPASQVLNVGGVEAMSRVEFGQRFIREYERLNPVAKTQCRIIDAVERAAIDVGYRSPLDARLDCSKLHCLLPDVAFTPTDEIMQQLCRLVLHDHKKHGHN